MTLTATPSGGDALLEAANSGHLGVMGEGSNAISYASAGETITFAISSITQTSGPQATIDFDGFTQISPLFSADSSDAGQIVDPNSGIVLFEFDNGDGSPEITESTNENPFIVDLIADLPAMVAARSIDGTLSGDNFWRINNLGVQFSINTDIAGDFDGDGDVDSDDLSQWTGDYGINGDSDANGDGRSDAADFLIWQQNFGTGVETSSQVQVVPEPGSVSLSLVGTAILYLTTNARALYSWRVSAR